MDKFKGLMEKFGILLLSVLILFVSYLKGELNFWEFIISSLIVLIGAPLCQFIFIEKLRVNKQRQIPWYGSPFIWIGLPVFGFLVYFPSW